jgi:nitrite reductase/ring-hydroxylating ferredoxin subunit
LNEGTVEGCRVICPWHGIPFDLRTGYSTSEEGFGVSVFETKIEGKTVLLKAPG